MTRTAGRRPIFFAQHLLRLAQSAELLAMHLPPPDLLLAACREVVARVADEAYLRIIVTRGSGRWISIPPQRMSRG